MLRLLVFLFDTALWVHVLFALVFVTSNLWEYEILYRHWTCHGVLIRQSGTLVLLLIVRSQEQRVGVKRASVKTARHRWAVAGLRRRH